MPIDFYYTEGSAPCRSVWMTAKMVGVELNLKELNLQTGEHMKPEFVAINPQHNVPTIVDDGFTMNESRAICAYLVNKYGKDDKLYPKDPQQRAVVDQRMYFDMGVFYYRFGEVYYPIMFHGATKLNDEKRKEMEGGIEFLDGFLQKSKYAAGETLTLADIVLVASAATMLATDKTVFDKYPRIQSWLDTCKGEIVDHEEANQKGADMFGHWAQAMIAKLG